MVNTEGSHDSVMLISPVLLSLGGDPWEDRVGLLPFDPEMVVVLALDSSGEEDVLWPSVWAGLGGGVGGALLLPGDGDFMLWWTCLGLTGGGVKSAAGLERERERKNS